MKCLRNYDGAHLTDRNSETKRTEHFGFRDGIEQPAIVGTENIERLVPPDKEWVATGAFLLGYPSQWDQYSYPLPKPEILGINGSFGAFRVLQQDVDGFNQYTEKMAEKLTMEQDQLRAKMFGRWPKGGALAKHDTDPGGGEHKEYFNYNDDPRGIKCPVGAHIRRANPRTVNASAKDGGQVASKRRIIRRGIPYGAKDSAEKGLLGLFICASLEDQFEFLMRDWLNKGGFDSQLPLSARDPVVGANNGRDSQFQVPFDDGKKVAVELPAFITTRAGLYCFYPGMSALRYMAA
jgi:deferrochelatase/peroxidase EfeB